MDRVEQVDNQNLRGGGVDGRLLDYGVPYDEMIHTESVLSCDKSLHCSTRSEQECHDKLTCTEIYI